MTMNANALSPQLKALKKTDLSPLIRMSGVMLPRLLDIFKEALDQKQKDAFDKVMPENGEKKFFFHLKDTPTPFIVMGMTQPLKMSLMSEQEVGQQKIKGIRLTTDDLQLVMGERTLGKMLRFIWRIKGQIFTILGIMLQFLPFLFLGPAELRDLRNRATAHFKPLTDLMP